LILFIYGFSNRILNTAALRVSEHKDGKEGNTQTIVQGEKILKR
jgi:hypothetical protein